MKITKRRGFQVPSSLRAPFVVSDVKAAKAHPPDPRWRRVKLTAEQRTTLGRIMKEKVGEFPPCAVCRNATGWSIGGALVAPEGAGPFVTFSCTKCGHTLQFHARVLGLVP